MAIAISLVKISLNFSVLSLSPLDLYVYCVSVKSLATSVLVFVQMCFVYSSNTQSLLLMDPRYSDCVKHPTSSSIFCILARFVCFAQRLL